MAAAFASSGETLIREGLRLEHLGRKLDEVGNAPEAAEKYRQAAELLAHAASVCPLEKASEAAKGVAKAANQLAGSAAPEYTSKAILYYKQAIGMFHRALAAPPAGGDDRPAVEQHIAEIEVRVMYLESLGGCPATVASGEHIKELRVAPAVSLGEVGVEAAAAASTPGEEPAQLVAVDALPAASLLGGAALPVEVQAAQAQPSQPAQPLDFMQEAVKMEAQAKALEAQGQKSAAVDKYVECLQVFAFVVKKEHNEKVKNMVRARMAEILDRAEALKAQLPK